jgi:hypothetical protein
MRGSRSLRLGVDEDMSAWVLQQMGHAPELGAGTTHQSQGQNRKPSRPPQRVSKRRSPQGLTLDEWLEFLIRSGFYLTSRGIRRARARWGSTTPLTSQQHLPSAGNAEVTMQNNAMDERTFSILLLLIH